MKPGLNQPQKSRPTTWRKPGAVRQRLAWIGAAVVTVAVYLLLTLMPGVAETVYGRALGPILTALLSRTTGLIPFSVAEIVLIGFLARQVHGAWRGTAAVIGGRRGILPTLGSGSLRLLQDLSILVVFFYIAWGMHYARPSLAERIGLEGGRGADIEYVAELTERFTEITNGAYLDLHGTDDLGRPTELPENREALFAALDAGWDRAADVLGFRRPRPLPYDRPKRFLIPGISRRMGFSGLYVPFTGETLLLWDLPASSFPVSVTHEQAHRFGVAIEAEAGFLGFVVAFESPDRLARYSAALFAQRQLLGALAAADPERAMEIVSWRIPGVTRDVLARGEYWRRYDGPINRAAHVTYDRVLRAHGVEGGILSYSLAVELLIAWERSREPLDAHYQIR